jgi:hypothetical protein
MAKHKYIESPEQLWELFEDYRKHEKLNPMIKNEYVGKDGNAVETELETPVTFEGFECYLSDKGIIQDLGDYSKNKEQRYTEYAPIITRIQKNCFVHNYKGAAVGLFNANLVARKLGISEKTENKNENVIQVLNLDPLDDSSDNISS